MLDPDLNVRDILELISVNELDTDGVAVVPSPVTAVYELPAEFVPTSRIGNPDGFCTVNIEFVTKFVTSRILPAAFSTYRIDPEVVVGFLIVAFPN